MAGEDQGHAQRPLVQELAVPEREAVTIPVLVEVLPVVRRQHHQHVVAGDPAHQALDKVIGVRDLPVVLPREEIGPRVIEPSRPLS